MESVEVPMMTPADTPFAPAHVLLPSTAAVQRAVSAIAAGRMVVVVVVDGADREDEGDLIVAAGTVTTEQVAFIVRYTTGILCAPMPEARADELRLPPMVTDNADAHQTAFTVTVDHRDSGTGVSAADRSNTLRALADRETRAEGLRRPGHIFPLRARDDGELA
jgi:3,4-dihydroxy 2-butanone 4-phosphate synthase/GTP cyclohydrolase II